jgi:two-component system, LytTR family, response regulator
MIRVLIVDDEPLAREGLRTLLRREPDIEVVGMCETGLEAITRIGELDPDLVLLDVQMPEFDGFEVIEHLGAEHMPPVVFITAYEQHAIRAFEVHALDYVLKPFREERLLAAIRHARRRIRGQRPDPLAGAAEAFRASGAAPPVTWLSVSRNGVHHLVKADTVDYFTADGNYVRVHVGTSQYLVRSTLTALAARLDRAQFARIHRSTIVNLQRVREIQPWFGGDCIALLHDGQKLKVSRTLRENVMRPLF